jgi:hypothetical protein
MSDYDGDGWGGGSNVDCSVEPERSEYEGDGWGGVGNFDGTGEHEVKADDSNIGGKVDYVGRCDANTAGSYEGNADDDSWGSEWNGDVDTDAGNVDYEVQGGEKIGAAPAKWTARPPRHAPSRADYAAAAKWAAQQDRRQAVLQERRERRQVGRAAKGLPPSHSLRAEQRERGAMRRLRALWRIQYGMRSMPTELEVRENLAGLPHYENVRRNLCEYADAIVTSHADDIKDITDWKADDSEAISDWKADRS